MIYSRLLYTSDNVKSHWRDIQKHTTKSQAVQEQNCQASADQDQPITSSVPCEENPDEPITNNVDEDSQPITDDVAIENHEQPTTNNLGEESVSEENSNCEMEIQQTESIKWRKTDPKCNDPTSENSKLTNGDMDAQDCQNIPPEPADDPDATSRLNAGVALPELDVDSLPAPANVIGRDLLNMFISGCGHDVKIRVEDKEIPAHK